MKVFVTGGTGLVGSHVIRQLVERGDSVVALRRAQGVQGLQGVRWVEGSLADSRILEQCIEECDSVVHAAAVILHGGTWDDFRVANVAPTEIIARAAARFDRRLVHISSVAVYGRRTTYEGGPRSVTEDFGMTRPTWPGDHYGRSKREAEQAVWNVAESTKLSAVALRPCVIYGEGDRTFANRVAKALARGIAPVIGNGDNGLSVVYAGNVAAAALCALDRRTVTGPFNVANDGGITQRGFLEAFAAGLGVRLRVIRVPRGAAMAASSSIDALTRLVKGKGSSMTMLKTAVQFLSSENPYVSDRAERQLGWKAIAPPPDAIERTARWFAAKRT